jgi:hypothetical protein
LPGDLRMAKGSLPIQLCYDSLHPTLFCHVANIPLLSLMCCSII